MRNVRLRSRLLGTFVAAILIIGASSAFGCAICKYSPDGQFGFCRWGNDRGWNDCTSQVRNTFTGATDCTLDDSSCGTYAGGGGGANPGDCWWTDVYGDCINAY
jgi:hypothetical protein